MRHERGDIAKQNAWFRMIRNGSDKLFEVHVFYETAPGFTGFGSSLGSG